MKLAFAPFSHELVDLINQYQEQEGGHKYNCPNDHSRLRATEDGLVCPLCSRVQLWAWDFTSNLTSERPK